MSLTVNQLLDIPFAVRNTENKLKIIEEGKPRPDFDEIIIFNGKSMSVNELYDQEIWLTASEKMKSVFCWTCLLFPILGTGCESIIANICDESLHSHILKHKNSASHINGFFQYRMCIKQHNVNTKSGRHLRLVYNGNREVLRRIIDVVCLFVSQTSPPRKSSKDYNILKPEDFLQMLILLKNYDNSNITDEAIKYVKECPEVLTATVEAIATILKLAIKKEIQSSSYVSLVLSEHSQNEKNPKLSTVLRYVYKGNICERFMEFTEFKGVKNRNIIKEHVLRLTSEHEMSSKVLSISCDGDVLLPLDMLELIAAMQRRSPFCLYVPCYFHDFNYVLEQRLSHFTECRLFFSIINSVKMFFQNNVDMCDTFNDITEGKIFNLNNFKLSNSQFLRILKLYRREFIDFFWHVANNSDKWNKDEIAMALGFQNILDEYPTVFMLETFHFLFNHVAILNEMLNSCSPENMFDNIGFIKEVLTNAKDGGFEKLWTLAITEMIEDCHHETLEAVGENETNKLKEIFLKVIDCTVEEINIRFKYVHKLQFLSILNCESNNKLIVSDYQIKELHKLHESLMDIEHLITEMEVLSKNGAIFGGKSVYETIDILTKLDLQNIFKNAYKLAEIILTMPCKPVSPTNKGSTKLDVINSWISVSEKSEMNSLIFLCIEKDYLEYLKTGTEFYDEVIVKLRAGMN